MKRSAPHPLQAKTTKKALSIRKPTTSQLSRINSLLLGLIILINLYVVLAPIAPSVVFWWQSHHGNQKQTLTARIHQKTTIPSKSEPKLQANHLVVPSMLLDQPIQEGPISQQYSILDKGIWHWPNSSTPDKGGNTVLLGHRFTYTNPRGVFYFLNKVAVGDEIGVTWSNQQYLYKVVSVTEVPPTDTAIEDNTPDARLTIFTCTPLWLPKDRLVVVAELETK